MRAGLSLLLSPGIEEAESGELEAPEPEICEEPT